MKLNTISVVADETGAVALSGRREDVEAVASMIRFPSRELAAELEREAAERFRRLTLRGTRAFGSTAFGRPNCSRR